MSPDTLRRSAFGLGLGARLAAIGAVVAVLWLGVWWAI